MVGILDLGRGLKLQGPIAQLAEHSADNAGVRGAIPLWPTKLIGPLIEHQRAKFCYAKFKEGE